LELSYYADAVGEVPEHTEHISIEPIDIGNGDISPEWGFDIIINGGFLRYGPWADRQRYYRLIFFLTMVLIIPRAELQRAFFPPAYHDGEVTPLLRPGDKRMWTALRVFVELRGGTTLQLPFREASKVYNSLLLLAQFTLYWCRIGNGMGKLKFRRDNGYGSLLQSIYLWGIALRLAILCPWLRVRLAINLFWISIWILWW
jgi:hypothetical protein